jgi:hypothetical protein
MDPEVLTVYECPFSKQRLGRNCDGGYVIADIPNVNYSFLIAGGINDDISFEEDFVNKYNTVECIAFDGTINRLPKENSRIKFIKKNIGTENTETITNLHDILSTHDNLFIKIDIEGAEIPWFKSLSNEQMNNINQIVLEFHCPYSDKEIEVFYKLNKNHVLVHLHPNNSCAGTRIHKGLVMPVIFECTYINKRFFSKKPELNKEPIPSKFDMPNNLYQPEIYMNYPPFVN